MRVVIMTSCVVIMTFLKNWTAKSKVMLPFVMKVIAVACEDCMWLLLNYELNVLKRT